MERIEAGEFSELYAKHFKHTIQFLQYKTTISHTDAEEIAQSAWFRAWVHRDQFRGESCFSTWVSKIAFNELRTRFRTSGRIEYTDNLPECAVHTDPDAAILVRELLDYARSSELNLLTMRYLLETPIEETAQELNRPIGTIKNLTFRAIQQDR